MLQHYHQQPKLEQTNLFQQLIDKIPSEKQKINHLISPLLFLIMNQLQLQW